MTATQRTALAGFASLLLLSAVMFTQPGRPHAAATQEGVIAPAAHILVAAETPEALQSDMTYGDRSTR